MVANRGNGRCNRYPSFLATRSLETTTHFVTCLSYWVYTNMIHTVVVRDRANQGRTKLRNCRVTLYAMCHSSSQQRLVRRVLVLTLKFEIRLLAYRCYNIFKKVLNLFFAYETLKKWPQKLLIIGPKCFLDWPVCPNQPKIIFHIINMSQDSSVY